MNKERNELPIGVFDSGVGGISVLAEMIKALPHEKFVYLADAGHAPYGTKSSEEVRSVSLAAAGTLSAKGIKAMVVACNTATSAGINEIRAEMEFPVIGMEPALKPAVAMSGGGTILVMATQLTLQENKFNDLLKKFSHEASIVPVPCPGLVELIESEAGQDEITNYLRLTLPRIELNHPKSVVLGCTHYYFVRNEILGLLGDKVVILDGNAGTVRQLVRMLETNNLISSPIESGSSPEVEFLASGDSDKVKNLCQRFLAKALGGPQ